MKIRFHTMLGTLHSWSIVSQCLARAMINIGGHDIYMKSTNNLEHFPDDLKPYLIPGYHGILSQGPADYIEEDGTQTKSDPKSPFPNLKEEGFPYDLEIAYTIFYQFPRRFFPQSKARAACWNFESSVLPPGWHLYHHAIDYVLPSSQYSYDIFAKNNIPEDKMIVVPHGVDINVFNPDIPPFKLRTEKKIKFLHNAIPHARKCHDRMIEAYLDAFTGDDDVCLIMKTKFKQPDRDKPFEVNVEEILEKAFKGRKNPPEIEIINDKFIPDIGSLYTACDAVVSMSAAEGFCLLPGTPVSTERGDVAIENVSKNSDFVYTHLGNKRKVVKTTKRKIKENIIGIRRHGCNTYFSGTKNHPHLAIKRDSRRFSSLRKLADKGELVASWVGLGDLEKGDLVVIPKPKIDYFTKNIIDIKDYVKHNIQENNGKVWLQGSFDKRTANCSLSKIANRVGCSFQHVSRVLSQEVPPTKLNKNIMKVSMEMGYKKPEPLKISRFIEIDQDLAKFFGLYIAEGSTSSGGSSFNINLHREEIYGQKLAREFCVRFGVPFCENIKENKYQLSGSSKILSSLLSTMFGSGAYNKKIPFELYKSLFIGDILHGIFYGDGSASQEKYSFYTSSARLRDDIFQILLHNDIFSNRRTEVRENNEYIVEVAASFNERFNNFIDPRKYNENVVLLNKTRNNAIIECRDCFLVPINKVMETYYEGEVYNLDIEEDNSFTSMGMATHNCLPLLEALACDMLVIAPRHGGQLEFLNDNNSLLINTNEMKAPISMQYWTHSPDAIVGDPDTRHCSELMRRAYENMDEEKARIQKAARETTEKFSWENAAQMILDLPIPEKSGRISEKKKVLYIVPYEMAGGGEVWVKQVIEKLDKNKYEPHIAFVSGISNELKNLFKDSGAIYHDLSNQGRGHALKAFVESYNFSVVHFYNSFGVYNVLRQAWSQGYRCRIVETVHSDLVWNDSMTKVSARDKLVSIIVSVSSSMGRKLLKDGNKNVAVLPQQVDWKRFDVPRSKKILKDLNIKEDFVVGYVGRLSPEKNLPTLLRCAQVLSDVAFVLVGDGPQGEALKQAAAPLKNVYFVGRQENVEEFYASFDILALPSSMEGLPLVILEAMACGTPVVASDVGAISEVVNDGVNGSLIWNPGAHLLFARAIRKLREDGELWKQYSNNSKSFAKAMKEKGKEFSINNIYNALFREAK